MKKNQVNKTEASATETEVLYGKHVILGLLEEGRQINKIFVQRGLSNPQISNILKKVKQLGIIYQEVPKSKLDNLTDHQNHQGIAATLPSHNYSQLTDIFDLARERDEDPFIVILDKLEDPHNLGSIIRTAAAVGSHGIIIPERRSVGLTGIVAKTSAGALEYVPVVRVTNLSQTIQSLKEEGIWVFASDLEGTDLRDWNTQGPIAIVIGNEGRGVSANIKKIADEIITIPMTQQVESLNASVAAALMMYEVARQRLPKGPI
ncbi:23S rRNA (guanosine(2251)-2'-O)-methyltransferase RlmB [Hutsoniella sourekii]